MSVAVKASKAERGRSDEGCAAPSVNNSFEPSDKVLTKVPNTGKGARDAIENELSVSRSVSVEASTAV